MASSSFVVFVGFCLFCIGCTVAQHRLIATKTYHIGSFGSTLPDPTPPANCTPEPDFLANLDRITEFCYVSSGEGVWYEYDPKNSTYYYYKHTYTFPNCTGSIKRTDRISIDRCGTTMSCPGSVFGRTCSGGSWNLYATKTVISNPTRCECSNSTEGMIINYKEFEATNCNGSVRVDLDLVAGACQTEQFFEYTYTPLLIPGFPLMVTRFSPGDNECSGDGYQTIVPRSTCVGNSMYTYPEICTCTTEPFVATTGVSTTADITTESETSKASSMAFLSPFFLIISSLYFMQ